MAASSPKTVEPEYDFDSWTPEAEEAALAAIAGKFRYIVVEGDYVGRFSDGTIVRVPLEFDMAALESIDESAAPADQLRAVLVGFGGEAAGDAIVGKSMIQVATFATTYFELVQRATEQAISKLNVRARLGE